MSLSRLLLLRSLRRSTTTSPTISISQTFSHPHPLQTPHSLHTLRSFAFSSAEEAAAERRRRKRRLRIEPPLHALRRDPSTPRPPPDPNAPRLPDTTSSLVGPRLNLHNRVQSLIRAGDLDSASSLARHAVFSRTRPTVFTCNAIATAMYRAKRYDDAVALFNFFFNQSKIVPNVSSYNALINTHCDCGRVDEALEVHRYILANSPFSPSSVTYRHLTKGLIDSDRIGEAIDLLREMLSKGHGADSLVYNNLIKGYLDLGNLDRANELFDELKERCLVYDGVVSATFMDWYFNQGKEKEAMGAYRSLLDREFRMIPATCNVLLECLLRHGRKKDAWALFDMMLDNHTPPNFQALNSETFSIMVNECFKLGKFSEAVDAFRKVGVKSNSKPFSMDVAGYNNIIVRFAEQGMIEEAEKFFEELRSKSLSPDVTGYRTLIDSYLKEKRIDDALQLFHRMVDANLRVLPLYANRWFSELIVNDKALESSQILTKMGEKDPKPDVLTYEIVMKGLCEVGAFDQCKEMINQMMGYSVGVTPTLREFLLDTFEKGGKKDEIERLLDPRRQVPSRPQPSGPSGPQNPRFLQSTTRSGSGQAGFVERGNKVGFQAGSVASQTPAGPFGQARNAGVAGSYGSNGVSASVGANGFAGAAGHVGFTNTGPAYQAGSIVSQTPAGPFGQGENARFAGSYGSSYTSAGATGFVGAVGQRFATQTGQLGSPGQMDNRMYPGTNQVGSTEFSGSVGQMGYTGTGSPNHFAPQSRSMGPQGDAESPRNQATYEPSGFPSQAGSTSFSGQVGHGGQPGYSGYDGQFAAQTGPVSPPSYTQNARYQGSHGDAESPAQVESAGYSQSLGHEQARY